MTLRFLSALRVTAGITVLLSVLVWADKPNAPGGLTVQNTNSKLTATGQAMVNATIEQATSTLANRHAEGGTGALGVAVEAPQNCQPAGPNEAAIARDAKIERHGKFQLNGYLVIGSKVQITAQLTPDNATEFKSIGQVLLDTSTNPFTTYTFERMAADEDDTAIISTVINGKKTEYKISMRPLRSVAPSSYTNETLAIEMTRLKRRVGSYADNEHWQALKEATSAKYARDHAGYSVTNAYGIYIGAKEFTVLSRLTNTESVTMSKEDFKKLPSNDVETLRQLYTEAKRNLPHLEEAKFLEGARYKTLPNGQTLIASYDGAAIMVDQESNVYSFSPDSVQRLIFQRLDDVPLIQ